MQVVRSLFCLLVLTTVAWSEPLNWLTKGQRDSLGQIYTGYADGFICRKDINTGVAGTYLSDKLGDIELTADRLAEISVFAMVIQAARTGKVMHEGPPEKAVPPHCALALSLYGPNGSAIAGLLEEPKSQ
jgi:hypothetical protein